MKHGNEDEDVTGCHSIVGLDFPVNRHGESTLFIEQKWPVFDDNVEQHVPKTWVRAQGTAGRLVHGT